MSPSLRDDLQSALGAAYTLEQELGGGGMSRVFVAEEARLGRKVVVKVLLPELAAGVSAGRFEREIMVAAQLAHPTIVPVLAAGEAKGLPYYTMPFVQGESLRAHLAAAGGPLPMPEVAAILRDVGRALSYAHERGIVHRDIKPDNVLLASGAALVTDFGIAKAISASRSPGGEGTLTGAGISIGTPMYMSPEQAMADPDTDSRADIYSFGCVAYELIAGQPPFHGRPMHKLLAAHIAEQPVDVASLRPECPPSLAAFVMRCLEKDPAHRPQSAAEIFPALETVRTPEAQPSATLKAVRQPSKRRKQYAFLVAGALALAAAAMIVVQTRRAGNEQGSSAFQSIAVLPFANVDGDTANTYFANGMAEELATSLSKVPGLRVVARNSTFREAGRQVNEQEAGKVLNVDALLAGSVRRAGPRMRLTARLIGVKDQSILWSDQYDREIKDVFQVQDEITRAIVSAIQTHLASSSSAVGIDSSTVTRNRETSNLAAHDLYLRAQFNLRRRAVPAAVDYFERAIRLDPNYARAHSGLSAALEMTPYFAGVPAPNVRDRVMAATQRALALDTTLAEAHTSRALAYQHAHQWSEAEREHRRAIAVDPNDGAAHIQYARFLLATGRAKEAYDEIRRAEILDPFSPVIASWVAYILLMMGMPDQALASARRGLELDSTMAPTVKSAAQVYLAAGNNRAAIATIDRITNVLPWPGFRAHYHAITGNTATAMRLVRDIEARRHEWAASSAVAWAYLGLKDTARALDALERATDDHEIWFMWYSIADPVYDPVRKSPRFAALVRRVGLDLKMFTTWAGSTRK